MTQNPEARRERMALGHARDNPSTLDLMAQYLRHHTR